ncbi:MAG TPA: hypothetical protein GX745_05615 [Clostridiales bacterium]|nr:hypothetical protein [Clostridiales bacterium]
MYLYSTAKESELPALLRYRKDFIFTNVIGSSVFLIAGIFLGFGSIKKPLILNL